MRECQWLREKNRGWELAGKTIGIIGFGNNGSAFGRLWGGWDVRVLTYDKYLERYGNEKVIAVELDALLDQSDIISLHIPLTHETNGMIDEQFISKCKTGVVIVNTSRGKVVKLDALVSALKSGKIKGACMDVLPYEPPAAGPDDFKKLMREIYRMENVVLSPHVAGWTMESKRKIAEVLLVKIGSIAALRTR